MSNCKTTTQCWSETVVQHRNMTEEIQCLQLLLECCRNLALTSQHNL